MAGSSRDILKGFLPDLGAVRLQQYEASLRNAEAALNVSATATVQSTLLPDQSANLSASSSTSPTVATPTSSTDSVSDTHKYKPT